jgi:serine/threonine-protein kinase
MYPVCTQPLLTGVADEYNPKFSPDGRWLAYASNESGRDEVYVQRYPTGARLAVSTEGANDPVWRRDGRELYFRSRDPVAPKLMGVSITPDGTTLRLGKPVPLLEMRVPVPTGGVEEYASSGFSGARYDVLPDGRFVAIRRADRNGQREIVVVQNYAAELKRLAPTR